MIDAFVHGRDIYATIASVAFGRDYLDCLGPENMPPDCGRPAHPEGKKYRGRAKAIVLGEPKGFRLGKIETNAPLYSNIH